MAGVQDQKALTKSTQLRFQEKHPLSHFHFRHKIIQVTIKSTKYIYISEKQKQKRNQTVNMPRGERSILKKEVSTLIEQ